MTIREFADQHYQEGLEKGRGDVAADIVERIQNIRSSYLQSENREVREALTIVINMIIREFE